MVNVAVYGRRAGGKTRGGDTRLEMHKAVMFWFFFIFRRYGGGMTARQTGVSNGIGWFGLRHGAEQQQQ